jgi:16S rRNA (cytidine1402-2'-O)-methyltransferase
MAFGTLYMIPTPLGNNDGQGPIDRALPPEVRAKVASLTHFAAENAKSARAFLKANGTAIPLQALHIVEIGHAPKPDVVAQVMATLRAGNDVGILSEAGAPGIADPGAQLAENAHGVGISVVPLVGPSSLLLALMASGLNGQCFAFHGYLPVKPDERVARIRLLEARSRKENETALFIETPYRNGALFDALLRTLSPSTRLCVAVDLTQATESITMQSVGDWRKAAPPNLDKRPAVFLFLAR